MATSDNRSMHPITIGCCGWSYKDWNGVFYPDKMPAGDYLSFYAEHFDTVEVDGTFYRTPSPSMVRGWHDKTPADHTVIDRSAQIESDAQLMRLLSQRVPVLAFVNNHFALATARAVSSVQGVSR